MNLKVKEQLFEKIYADYYQRLCFYASKHVGDIDEAEDIVQNVFIKLWEKEVSFENEYALSSYLFSSVYHASLNRIEMDSSHQKHFEKLKQLENIRRNLDYETDRIEDEVIWRLSKAMDSLPEECRKVLQLSYLQEHNISEVAQLLNISENTVKSQRARGKKLLQERLKDLYPIVAILFFHCN